LNILTYRRRTEFNSWILKTCELLITTLFACQVFSDHQSVFLKYIIISIAYEIALTDSAIFYLLNKKGLNDVIRGS